MRNSELIDVRKFNFRNNVIHRWGAYGLRLRAESNGNIMCNFLRLGFNEKKIQKAVLVLMGKEEPQNLCVAIHGAGR